MTEFHDAGVLEPSRTLFEAAGEWAMDGGGVILIGGWAAHGMVVKPNARMASRDLDIIIHSAPRLAASSELARALGLEWRRRGRTTFNDPRLIGDPTGRIAVDVFVARYSRPPPAAAPGCDEARR